MSKLVSVIIPTYNEENYIRSCLISLKKQSYKPVEIIVVDDGSKDKTLDVAKKEKVITFSQKHLGPGVARNLGAKHAKGPVLVFVDSDMTFDREFISDLVKPIINGKSIGTFSKNEFVKNQENIWSICWNQNRGLPKERMIPKNYPEHSPVYRAILKDEFRKVFGYETSGQYTDDWSLARKLNRKADLAKGAIYYHFNPSNLSEIYSQARWIGKSEFISGSLIRRLKSCLEYFFLTSIFTGIVKSLLNFNPHFFVFKLVYDFGIFLSVVKSFANERKNK